MGQRVHGREDRSAARRCVPRPERGSAAIASKRPKFFPAPADFRAWLERHHASESELLVGFYKKSSGRPSVTYHEALDEALCFGWIDGVRRTIDDESYCQRFSPRRKGSYWSAVNTRRAQELIREGRMHGAGLEAFEARDAARSDAYSFERTNVAFSPELEAKFRASARAWRFFEAQPPGYRKTATWFVMSAKQEATRLRRLQVLIKDSAAGRRLAGLERPKAR
ncbi:MAG TPA: YdeI/OmpD-associated family protein [Gemmatimonadaceae bacterium]|nr:YdeI/OmpD-associated family protein [Gemmatimonadaceae bacterium]